MKIQPKRHPVSKQETIPNQNVRCNYKIYKQAQTEGFLPQQR